MKRFIVVFLGLGAACLFASPVLYSKDDLIKVGYPDGYRQWTHVKTMEIRRGHPLYEKFGGVHHVYANLPAFGALKANRRNFPDGAVLVLDLLAVETKGHAVSEGKRKFLGVMKKNHRLFADTGGWGFEAFDGDSGNRLVIDAETQCFKCHAQQDHDGFVFSRYRE